MIDCNWQRNLTQLKEMTKDMWKEVLVAAAALTCLWLA